MTAACETCRELIGGYVLDALEPAERDLVRHHIETCDACARDHAELAAVPALLDVADSADAVPLRPPPRLEEAVLDRFARESRPARPGASAPAAVATPGPGEPAPPSVPTRRRRWLIPATAVLACALAALAATLLLTGDDSGDDGAPAAQQRVYEVALTGAGPLPRAAGDARLYPGDTGTGVHLVVSGLDPDNYNYELWCVRDDGWRMSAGTFRVDANGRADVDLTTAAKPSEYDSLSIQARPAGRGSKAPGPRVLVGRLRS